MPLIDKMVSLVDTVGGLAVRQTQVIPDEFISELKREKIDTLHTPMGEFHRVASIPTGFVDEMMAEGIDINRAPVADIMRWLRKKELDAFITTNKRI